MGKIVTAELSVTFKDAIVITQELGIPYLWTDSLRIIQDEQDDWNQEAAKMGQSSNEPTLQLV